MAQAHWAQLWPDDGTVASVDPALLEFFVADISVSRVEGAMDTAARKFPEGGPRVIPYFVAICRNMRRQDMGAAARGVWVVLLACPECEANGLAVTVFDGHPVLECVDCGARPRIVRGRLDP